MSPAINPTQLTIQGFPRVSGDEPRLIDWLTTTVPVFPA